MTNEEIESAQRDQQKYLSSGSRIINISSNNTHFVKGHLTLSKRLEMRILLGTNTSKISISNFNLKIIYTSNQPCLEVCIFEKENS